MSLFAREAKSRSKANFETIGRPYSFFDYREHRFGDLEPLGRLLSQVRRLEADTMVVEVLTSKSSQDLIDESEDLRIRVGVPVRSQIVRLSFFRRVFKSIKELEAADDDDFLGYLIIKEDWAAGELLDKRVYESVLKTSRQQNNFVRGAPVWSCRVQGRLFKIRGYLYAQQNALTNVCAHVALRTAASAFHPGGDMSYRAMNKLLGIDHKKNWVGRTLQHQKQEAPQGLNIEDMVKVLEASGARCIHADYSQPGKPSGIAPPPYQRYVYSSIESGFPAMLVFDTSNPDCKHAVPVFGHTLNQDLWVPNAERLYFKVGASTHYLPSDSWLSSFIVHDDNWGSNFCCPKHFLKPLPLTDSGKRSKRNPATNSEWVAHVIATVPKEVKLNPLHAELIGVDYLFAMLPDLPQDGNPWGGRLMSYAEKGLLVFRPLLISGAEYADHLKDMIGWKHSRIPETLVKALRSVLGTKKYWMVEMSVPELFSSNLRKVGEVLLRSDHAPATDERDFLNFVIARLPGHFAIAESTVPSALKTKSCSAPRFKFVPTHIQSHVRLFGLQEEMVTAPKTADGSTAR